jgi:hypothetical protein
MQHEYTTRALSIGAHDLEKARDTIDDENSRVEIRGFIIVVILDFY